MMRKLILILLLIATLALPDYLVRRITNDPPLAEDDFPTWSPDGTKIAYESEQNGKHDIWIVPVAGGTATRLTYSADDNRYPSWSFDGTRIAFTNCVGTNYAVKVIVITSGIETYVTDGYYPSWSPDGIHFVLCRIFGENVHLINRNITTGEEIQLTQTPGINTYPDWSHDGSKIAYDFGDYLPSIWTIPSGGGEPQQLPIYYGYRPKWNPEGTKICFSGGSAQGNYVIWVYDLLKNKLTQVTPGVDPGPDTWSDFSPDWSPDGTKIAFRRLGNIYILDFTQQQKELVTLGKIKAYFR
jgi:Tol biopolymer transport system component